MLSDMPMSPPKSYPRLTVDVDQFPGIDGDVDENFSGVIQGRICGRSHTDYCNTVEIEITKISDVEAGDTPMRIAMIGIADQELSKLKGKKR